MNVQKVFWIAWPFLLIWFHGGLKNPPPSGFSPQNEFHLSEYLGLEWGKLHAFPDCFVQPVHGLTPKNREQNLENMGENVACFGGSPKMMFGAFPTPSGPYYQGFTPIPRFLFERNFRI